VVDRLWRELGADVEHMQVERHDEVLAATSHLPHLLAFGLVDSLAKRNENLEIFRYAAGGFRDFTRIAGSDPVMWHDIFLANREAVLRTLDTFRSDLDALRDAVDAGTGTNCWACSPAPGLPASISVKSWPAGPMWTL
jgi:3-phosphoshikimate 1-carboxyvinyltransferase